MVVEKIRNIATQKIGFCGEDGLRSQFQKDPFRWLIQWWDQPIFVTQKEDFAVMVAISKTESVGLADLVLWDYSTGVENSQTIGSAPFVGSL